MFAHITCAGVKLQVAENVFINPQSTKRNQVQSRTPLKTIILSEINSFLCMYLIVKWMADRKYKYRFQAYRARTEGN